MIELLKRLASSTSPDWDRDGDPAFLILDDDIGLATALAASWHGQRFTPYVFNIDRYPAIIRIAADRLQWDLRIITPSIHQVGSDFLRLASHHRCLTASDFEHGFVLMNSCPVIEERCIFITGLEIDVRTQIALKRIATQYDKKLIFLLHAMPTVKRDQLSAIIEAVATKSAHDVIGA